MKGDPYNDVAETSQDESANLKIGHHIAAVEGRLLAG
jgi:hypothetical protein